MAEGGRAERVIRRGRIFHARRDVLAEYNDRILLERYRFDRAGIEFITDLVKDKIQSGIRGNHAISPLLKVVVTLRYLATGRIQLCGGDDLGMSQPTVCRVTVQTIEALATPDIVRQFIDFPTTREAVGRNMQQFQRNNGFPAVVGAIGGTHVRIIEPVQNKELYVNKHRHYSINVQVACDAECRLIDIVTQWPGSTHDSFILGESGLKQLFEDGTVPEGCHLLGDSGYACTPWLLTPYLPPRRQQPPLQDYQGNYNRAHRVTRSIVARTIGQLKRRFHILHMEVRLSPARTCSLIMACAVLYNISKTRNAALPPPEYNDDDDDGDDGDGGDDEGDIMEEDGENLPPGRRSRTPGLQHREEFARGHFS